MMSEINLIKAPGHTVPPEVARKLTTCPDRIISATDVIVGVEIAGSAVITSYGYQLQGTESEEAFRLKGNGAESFYQFYESNMAVDPSVAPASDCRTFAMTVKDHKSLTWDELRDGGAAIRGTYSGNMKYGEHYVLLSDTKDIIHHMIAFKDGERTVSKLGENGCLAIASLATMHALYHDCLSTPPLEPGGIVAYKVAVNRTRRLLAHLSSTTWSHH